MAAKSKTSSSGIKTTFGKRREGKSRKTRRPKDARKKTYRGQGR